MATASPSSPNITLSHSSTPGLTKLTALQRLEVEDLNAVHPAVLGGLPKLQHLVVGYSPLRKAAGEPGLVALSTLTALQHLELACDDLDESVAATPADWAALTASIQLTRLYMTPENGGLVPGLKYDQVFPQGCRLPQLRQLYATMGLLGNAAAVRALVEGCPALEYLDLSMAVGGEPGDALMSLGPNQGFGHTVQALSGLSKLSALQLQLENESWSEDAWRGLAKLTALRSVDVGTVTSNFVDLVALTSCQQLTYLSAFDAVGGDQFELKVCVSLCK